MPRGGYRRGGYYNSPQADLAQAAKRARNFVFAIPKVEPSTYEAVRIVTKHARKRMMVNDGNETHMNEKGTNENGLDEQLKMVESPNAKVTNEKENCVDKSTSSDCDDRMTKDGENETAQSCQNVDDPSTKCQTEKTDEVEKLSDNLEEEIPPISRERLEALQLKKETLKEDLERSSKEIQSIESKVESLNKSKSQMVWLLKQVITLEAKQKMADAKKMKS